MGFPSPALLCIMSFSPALFLFQDWNQTWHTNIPGASWCFESSIIAWIPCAYLWICFPFYYWYLRHRNKGYIRMSHIFKAKMVRGKAQGLVLNYLNFDAELNFPK